MLTCRVEPAELPLEFVIGDLKFSKDALDTAAQLELTVMAVPVQPCPMAALHFKSEVRDAKLLRVLKWAVLYAGLPVEYVIGHPDFFNEVLDNAAQLELTVMALPVRPVPLAPLREKLYQRLASQLGSVSRLSASSRTAQALWSLQLHLYLAECVCYCKAARRLYLCHCLDTYVVHVCSRLYTPSSLFHPKLISS